MGTHACGGQAAPLAAIIEVLEDGDGIVHESTRIFSTLRCFLQEFRKNLAMNFCTHFALRCILI